MNYKNIYDSIISSAKSRVLPKETYTEKHHVTPRCMGGTDLKDNLVRLTPREHYVCHQLLTKIYPEVPGLAYAVFMMTWDKNGNRVNNRMYGWIRERYSTELKKRVVSEETRAKLSILAKAQMTEDFRKQASERGKSRYASFSDEEKEAHARRARKENLSEETTRLQSEAAKNRVVTDEARLAMSIAGRGRIFSEEHKNKIREASKRENLTEEVRQRKSDAQKGSVKSAETREKISIAKKAFYQRKREESLLSSKTQ